jgi:hypothetical protein
VSVVATESIGSRPSLLLTRCILAAVWRRALTLTGLAPDVHHIRYLYILTDLAPDSHRIRPLSNTFAELAEDAALPLFWSGHQGGSDC